MPDYWEPGLNDFEKKYQWMTFGENCQICDMMRGRVYTLDFFVSTGFYPGFHEHCDCQLWPVPDDTPESDREDFGSYVNTYLGFFGSLFSKTWRPYNLFILDEFMRATPEGGTIKDALSAFNSDSKGSGYIKNLGWFHALRDPAVKLWQSVKIYESINGYFTSEEGLQLRPRPLRPYFPYSTYKIPNFSSLYNW